MGSVVSSESEEPDFGADGCTCKPWTRQGGEGRYLDRPTDTVDMVGGWERQADCPHHGPKGSDDSLPDDSAYSRLRQAASDKLLQYALKGSASSSPDERCGSCGHKRVSHNREGCVVCAVGFGLPRCPTFVPADAETAGEPEAPVCSVCGQEAAEKHACDPEFIRVKEALERAKKPARPPYTVAYATGSGDLIELALPGEVTVGVHEGALIICHPSGVLGIQQVKPMEGA